MNFKKLDTDKIVELAEKVQEEEAKENNTILEQLDKYQICLASPHEEQDDEEIFNSIVKKVFNEQAEKEEWERQGFWRTIVQSHQWTAWYKELGKRHLAGIKEDVWDIDESQECNLLSPEHFQSFLNFTRELKEQRKQQVEQVELRELILKEIDDIDFFDWNRNTQIMIKDKIKKEVSN